LVFRQVVVVLLTLAGVGLALSKHGLDWHAGSEALVGDGLMIVTALCGATYGVLAQRAFARYSALTVTTYAMVLGTLLLLPAALVEGLVSVFLWLDGQTLALLVFLGVFGGALGFFLWTFAWTRLTPTQVAVYVNLNPLVATVLGAALLAERLTSSSLLAFAQCCWGCCWLIGRSGLKQLLPSVVVKARKFQLFTEARRRRVLRSTR
jgi:drug/metabolite transporter (DMT)-like permease